ncbi:MAG: PhzF family phenazine biosynthesis protein [Chlamydiia bacterium]|nr:PhzF family phenazine biosynthesis protein [Chlamydiia bacterium]
MRLFVVDAFASKPFVGNPAAVVFVEDFLSDKKCQQIAAEMNLSETVFVKAIADQHFHLRWFTPSVEVKLCGHATLATSHILYEKGLACSDKAIHFDSLSGVLTAEKDKEKIVLDFPLQRTGKQLECGHFETILKTPVINAVQAYDDIIIELQNEKAVRELSVSPADLKEINCRGVIITGKGTGDYDFVSRFFGSSIGMGEDPVTGSAHCKLADYWQKKLSKETFVAYQASKRGGELFLSIRGERLKISGHAVTIIEGTLRIHEN